jgi:hypothetical protein
MHSSCFAFGRAVGGFIFQFLENVFPIVGVFRGDAVDGVGCSLEEFDHPVVFVEGIMHFFGHLFGSIDEFDCVVMLVLASFVSFEGDFLP